MRILHIIDAGKPARARVWQATPALDQALAAVSLLMSRASTPQTACIAGPDAARRRALVAGLDPTSTFSIAGRQPRLVGRIAASVGPFDAIHAWGDLAIVFAGAVRRLTPADALRPAILVCAPAAASLWNAMEVTHVQTPPPAEARGPDPIRRGAMRASMGLAERDVAMILLGDPPRADALRFVFLQSLMSVAGGAAVGLLPAAAAQVGRAGRFAHRSDHARVIVSDRSLTDLLAAADLAVFDGGGPGPTTCRPAEPGAGDWPIALAHAAGVPAVAPDWAADRALYGEAAGACLAHNSSLPELARKLLPLIEDRALRATTAASVLAAARTVCPPGAFVRAVERAWSGLRAPAGSRA